MTQDIFTDYANISETIKSYLIFEAQENLRFSGSSRDIVLYSSIIIQCVNRCF